MPRAPNWTKEEEERLALCMAHDMPMDEIELRWPTWFGYGRTNEALKAGRSRRYVKEWRGKYETDFSKRTLPPIDPDAITRHVAGQPVPGITDGPRVTPNISWDPSPPEERWEKAEERNDRLIDYHKERHKAGIEFQTAKPIALSFISDQHITSEGPTDLRRMRRDAELIRDTPGLYGVLGGDGVDNHIKHRSAMIASGSKPGEQWTLYDHYLGIFGHKLVAMISGNHDDWTKDLTDLDMVGRLAQKHRIFYAPDHVVLDVTLLADGAQSYRVKLRHQYRFNSTLNQGHTVIRMWEMDDEDFDIGVVCHHHEAYIGTFTKHGKVRIAMRPGSYQYTSGHSRRYGYAPATPTCPTVILFPGSRRMVEFKDASEAASYLTWLRSGWPDTGEVFAA